MEPKASATCVLLTSGMRALLSAPGPFVLAFSPFITYCESRCSSDIMMCDHRASFVKTRSSAERYG